ncbi:TolC family protein [Vallitalea okinawensis]|uniref:TolC family protein n=1 Tax=Vallitalea okinawensis TaxID=2078660 RepID=UPI000CFC3DB0|nr:TolC family protein [Vallitalea okinawensis]
MMKIKRKSLFTVFLLSMFILSIVPMSAENVEIYSMEKLLDMYIENSHDIEIMELEYELTELKYQIESDDLDNKERQMTRDKDDFYDTKDNSSSQKNIDEKRDEYYASAKAYAASTKDLMIQEFEIKNQDKYVANDTAKKKNSFKNDLWQLYELDKQLEVLNATSDLYKSKYEVAQLSYSLENMTESDLNQALIDYEQMVLNSDTLINNLDMLKGNVYINLGIEPEGEPQFDIVPPQSISPVNITYNDLLSSHKSNSLDYEKQSYSLEAEKVYFDILAGVFLENSDDYQENLNNYKKVQLDFYNYEKELDQMVLDVYYNYQKTIDDYNYAKDTVELAQRQYNEAETAFEVGQISALDMDGAKLQLLNAELTYDQSLISCAKATDEIALLMDGISIK